MNYKTIDVVTLADGTFSATANLTGEVLSVGVVLGTATSVDVTITDTKTGDILFDKDSIAASGAYAPLKLAMASGDDGASLAASAGPPAIDNKYAHPVAFGQVTVAVANGGNALTAKVYIGYHG